MCPRWGIEPSSLPPSTRMSFDYALLRGQTREVQRRRIGSIFVYVQCPPLLIVIFCDTSGEPYLKRLIIWASPYSSSKHTPDYKCFLVTYNRANVVIVVVVLFSRRSNGSTEWYVESKHSRLGRGAFFRDPTGKELRPFRWPEALSAWYEGLQGFDQEEGVVPGQLRTNRMILVASVQQD